MDEQPKRVIDPEIIDAIHEFAKMISGEATHCLHCNQPIDHLEQVGRCVYAEPCGHRQYQGRLPKIDP